jgi:hypothetical protein
MPQGVELEDNVVAMVQLTDSTTPFLGKSEQNSLLSPNQPKAQ